VTDDVTRSRQAAVDRRMRERNELAEMIRDACWPDSGYPQTPLSLADAILAAGWRKS
jgi:hypothetical protein